MVENVLIKEWHFDVSMRVVEVDRALQISARDRQPDRRLKVTGDITFEIIEKDEKLAVRGREYESLGIEIDDGGAGGCERFEHRFDRVQHRLRRRHERIESIQSRAGNTDSCTFES